MLKKILTIFSVVVLSVCFLSISAFAEEVDAVATDYAEIKFPTWLEYEKLRDTVPTSVNYSGVDYTLDKHFLTYGKTQVYDNAEGKYDYTGYAKLWCYTFDSSCVVNFDVGSHFSYMNWESAGNESKANVYIYYYNFGMNRWEYFGNYSYRERFVSLRGESGALYADFSIPVGNLGEVFEAETVKHLSSPSWQSLTWNELGAIPSTMVSEILGILPVLIAFFVMSIAIHKGVSFLIAFIRNA